MFNSHKILFVPEFDSFGGTRSYFKKMLSYYSSQNYDVVIALCEHQLDMEVENLIQKYGFSTYTIPSRNGVYTKYLKYFPVNLLYDIFSILPLYIKEKPDMIVVSNGTPGMFIGLILFPVCFLYTFHTYPLKDKIFVQTYLQKLFTSIFLNERKIIHTVSEYSKIQILNYWVPKEKSKFIKVIYNSTGFKEINRKVSYAHEKRHLILTLGHVIWYKSPKLWIEVAKNVLGNILDCPVDFVWAGDGPLLTECRLAAKETGFDGIKFIGFKDDVEDLFRNSTIYFQPSLLESHGISVVEAMAHGLPCVVSNVGGLPESVVNGETGFVCTQDDVNSYVSKIIRLLKDDELRENFGHRGKLRYSDLFSEEVHYAKMMHLYHDLLYDD